MSEELRLPGGGLSRIAQAGRLVQKAAGVQAQGRVVQLVGLVIESEGPVAAVGEICRIQSSRQEATLAEVVGFRSGRVLLMPLGEVHGIQPGSMVTALGRPLQVGVGEQVMGRVLTALGEPLDDLGPLLVSHHVPVNLAPPHPLKRQRIKHTLTTSIKALDTFIPCGRGQRLGIFAGSGVGKSTLLGMMASRAEADVNVIALIGERGREVREFLEKDLDEVGRRKSVVIVATSNEPALVRIKGAYAAMAIAEYFRDCGKNVLLMMDSVTRFAMAQRELGLAVGEPPATRGYTPSVFALLPQLLERAGAGERGAITAFFTVLVEGDDMNEPIADAVRGILDGHIVLSRELAQQNHYPAIDVLQSVSRLTRDLCTEAQLEVAGAGREALALYHRNSDLISLGAYVAGSNPMIDRAIRSNEPLKAFLRQRVGEGFALQESWRQLGAIVAEAATVKSAAAK